MSVFVTKVTVNPEKTHGFIAHRLGAGRIWHIWPSILPKKMSCYVTQNFAYIDFTLVFENHDVITNLL